MLLRPGHMWQDKGSCKKAVKRRCVKPWSGSRSCNGETPGHWKLQGHGTSTGESCKHLVEPAQGRGCVRYMLNSCRSAATRALWSSGNPIPSPWPSPPCFKMWCSPRWVSVLLWSNCFMLCSHSFVLGWDCLVCATVYSKYVTCLWFYRGVQLRGCFESFMTLWLWTSQQCRNC